MRCAIHDKTIDQNGTVANVIIGDPDFCNDVFPNMWRDVDSVTCDLGYTWDAATQTYTAPPGG